MKLLLENWREFVKQEVEEFMPHGEVRAVERIGSSTLSPEEQAEQDLEKYGYVRDEGDRDFRFDVISMSPTIDWIQNAFTLND